MEPVKFSWRARVKSFVYAFNGLKYFFRWGHNARIHGVAAVLAIILSLVLNISDTEILFVAIAIGMVWLAELFNTAIELIMDHLSPEIHPQVKIIKDLSAAAVLVAAVVSIVVAAFIFIPKIL